MTFLALAGRSRHDLRPREGLREMGQSLKRVGAITLFVDDPQRSKAFYGRVFGVQAAFEDDDSVVFELDNLFLNLLERGAAVEELLGPVAAAGPGASFQLTVWVEDADGVCADL